MLLAPKSEWEKELSPLVVLLNLTLIMITLSLEQSMLISQRRKFACKVQSTSTWDPTKTAVISWITPKSNTELAPNVAVINKIAPLTLEA